MRHALGYFVDASQIDFDEGAASHLLGEHASLGRPLQHCLDLYIFTAWRRVNIVQDHITVRQAMLDLHGDLLLL